MRFTTASGFANGEEYFQLLKDTFDVLWDEGEAGSPKMMSIGLHCRLVGMPGRFAGLKRFVDYVLSKDKVWIAKRIDIAEHWIKTHPFEKPEIVPSELAYDDFTQLFGNVFRALRVGRRARLQARNGPGPRHRHRPPRPDVPGVPRRQRRGAPRRPQRPPRPRRQARRRQAPHRLLEAEQASAGLDALTDPEREKFGSSTPPMSRNSASPSSSPSATTPRPRSSPPSKSGSSNSREDELATACRQVERIAELRIGSVLA